jgi:hypothetical protein
MNHGRRRPGCLIKWGIAMIRALFGRIGMDEIIRPWMSGKQSTFEHCAIIGICQLLTKIMLKVKQGNLRIHFVYEVGGTSRSALKPAYL